MNLNGYEVTHRDGWTYLYLDVEGGKAIDAMIALKGKIDVTDDLFVF